MDKHIVDINYKKSLFISTFKKPLYVLSIQYATSILQKAFSDSPSIHTDVSPVNSIHPACKDRV